MTMQRHADLEIFGRRFACECGRTHDIEPREIVYAPGSIARLPAVCEAVTAGRRVAVFMDARTRAAAGARACAALAAGGWQVREVLVPDAPGGESPVCDDETKDKLGARLAAVDLLVSVGAGVMTDLARWTALDRGLRFVSVATAASMNGYSSANIAATVAGVKVLLHARPPAAVVAEPAVIAGAPWELTASGLGDILAKSVSSADWRLNHLLFDEYYCARAVGLIADIEPLYLDHPEDLRARRPAAVDALFRGLLLTGAAMTMAETSAPASGGEHLLSHALDMMSSLDGVAHDLHGRQVGVGTVLASAVYRRVLAVESPAWAAPEETVDASFWGRLTDEVGEQYAGKVERLRQARAMLSRGDAWDRLRADLAPMLRAPETIRDGLRRAGAAWRAEDIGCDRDRLLTAFLHGRQMRARFTILDLARLIGVLPDAAAKIIEEWA